MVAAGLAEQCEVQLSYSIGQAEPVSVKIETFGTGKIEEVKILERVKRHFDFRPGAIIRDFELQRLPGARADGFYARLACYGQMGRTDLELPWEETDKAELLKGKS